MKRAYVFPLVFAATGGMGPATTSVYIKLASIFAEKQTSIIAAAYFG